MLEEKHKKIKILLTPKSSIYPAKPDEREIRKIVQHFDITRCTYWILVYIPTSCCKLKDKMGNNKYVKRISTCEVK